MSAARGACPGLPRGCETDRTSATFGTAASATDAVHHVPSRRLAEVQLRMLDQEAGRADLTDREVTLNDLRADDAGAVGIRSASWL